jgi:hypothetical protein
MYVRSFLALLLALTACGGDDEPSSALPPRCPGLLDDGSDDPTPAGPFDAPSDFERTGCGEDGALEDVDVCGIWHLDLAVEEYRFAAAIRFDDAGGDDLDGLLFGHEAFDARHTASDLFLRQQEVLDDAGTPVEVVRVLDACEVRGDGVVAGLYARCIDAECSEGTFEAHKVEQLDEAPSSGMTLLGEWNGPPDEPWPDDALTLNVRHRGDVAYVTRHDGLHMVDVSDPAAPSDIGFAPVGYPDALEYYNDLKIVDAGERVYALMGSNLRGVIVIDVTDAEAPVEVATFPLIMDDAINVHTLFVEGTRVYFAMYGVEVWDISDPTAAVRLGGYVAEEESLNGVHDLYVEDSVAYLNNWDLGMIAVDLADPAQPEVVGVFDSYDRRTSHSNWVTRAGGRTISVHGDEDFGAHVRIVDVGGGFDEIGSYQTRPEVSVHNIMADDETAYVTYYQDGLRVLDLADPTAPREVAHYQSWPGPEPGYGYDFYEGAIGVDLDPEKGLVFLADTHRGLLILMLDH